MIQKRKITETNTSAISRMLFLIFLFSLTFTDLPTKETALGFFGESLANFILVPVFIACLFDSLFSGKIKINISRMYILPIAYMAIFSFLILLVVGNMGDWAYGTYKCFSNTILMTLLFFSFYYFDKNIELIKKYAWVGYFVVILGAIICDGLGITLYGIVHTPVSNLLEYNRLRGFCSEASAFAANCIVFGFIAAYYAKNKILRYVYIISMVGITLASGSKGGVIILVVALAVYYLIASEKNALFKIVLAVISIVIGVFVIITFVADAFLNDLEQFSSFATRASSVVLVPILLQYYPFGTGFGLFVQAFQEHALDAFDLLNEVIPVYNLSHLEIVAEVNTGKAASIKNAVGQLIAYFGIPCIMYMLYKAKNMINIVRAKRDAMISYFCIVIIFGICTAFSLSYTVILALVVITSRSDIVTRQ